MPRYLPTWLTDLADNPPQGMTDDIHQRHVDAVADRALSLPMPRPIGLMGPPMAPPPMMPDLPPVSLGPPVLPPPEEPSAPPAPPEPVLPPPAVLPPAPPPGPPPPDQAIPLDASGPPIAGSWASKPNQRS